MGVPPTGPAAAPPPPRYSFPGGKREAADGGAEGTALREAREELGLNLREESVWGRLRGLPERVRSGNTKGDRTTAMGHGDRMGIKGHGDRGNSAETRGRNGDMGQNRDVETAQGHWGRGQNEGWGQCIGAEWGQSQCGDTEDRMGMWG